LIQKYQSEIKDLGVLRFENAKGINGRPQKYALLNEEQSVFILTLSKNTMAVVKLKKELSWQFVSYRKLMVQKQQARLDGKKRRLELTDSIKKLVKLAEKHGSKNANRYYISITNMIYKQVFDLKKVPNHFRDSLGVNELSQIELVEWKLAEWLNDSLTSCLDYHEPYHEIKKKLKNLVAVIGVINLNRQIAA
jgi:phage regulator Rha-like protein